MKSEIKWIYGYGRSHVLSIIIYTALGLSSAVVGLFSSLVSKDLVDIITGQNTGELLKTFITIIAATVFGAVISQFSIYFSSKITLKVENNIKADIYDKIMQTEWEALSDYHSGDLASRWVGDAANIANGILSLFPNFVIYLFKFAGALYLVCKYDASFAVFAILSVPISLITSRVNMKRMSKANMEGLSVNSKMSSFTQESFSNTQSIKALNMVPLYSRRLRGIQSEYTDMRLRYQKVNGINSILITLTTLLVTYSTYGWGIYKVWHGDITYGTMTMFLALSTSLSGTVQSLLSLVPGTISLTNAASRLMKIVELPKEDYSKVPLVEDFYERHYSEGIGVSICDTAYTYKSGTQVFESASLSANPREVIGLVGPSGEGKTTMLRLLLSIITPAKGSGYVVSGSDKMELSASTRLLFAYVPQGNTMFSGTIAENMRNVKEDATDEEIIDALKLAKAWDFVEKLPEGINSELKERGGGLSEGQAQRLSIARALIKKAPILLLDEATSALDIDTQREVLAGISADSYPRTCILTTHRPEVMEICDRVYTISKLKVSEDTK